MSHYTGYSWQLGSGPLGCSLIQPRLPLWMVLESSARYRVRVQSSDYPQGKKESLSLLML